MADEASDDPFGYMSETRDFNPFGEIVDGDQYEPMTIRSMRMYGADDVDAPGREGPRRNHDLQLLRRSSQ